MQEISMLNNRSDTRPGLAYDAAEAGFQKLGIKVTRFSRMEDIVTPDVIFWGWKPAGGQVLRACGKNILVIENGYLGDRTRNYTSLGWNGLNGKAVMPVYEFDKTMARSRAAGVRMKPWKNDPQGKIVILGQVEVDASVRQVDIRKFYEVVGRIAQHIWDKPVYFRPHPESLKHSQGVLSVEGLKNCNAPTLEECLNEAFFTICYNSNSSLDSVLHGVPTFIADKGAIAYDLGSHDLRALITPDREKAVDRIAHQQWTLEEIASGEPLKAIINVRPKL